MAESPQDKSTQRREQRRARVKLALKIDEWVTDDPEGVTESEKPLRCEKPRPGILPGHPYNTLR
eukprot:708645-Prorocentrum_minimum.AAC.3